MLGFRMSTSIERQMNIWLSSAENHAWTTAEVSGNRWEAEIDRLMRAQASTAEPKSAKRASIACRKSPPSKRHSLPGQSECALRRLQRGRRRESRILSRRRLERRAPHPERKARGRA